MRFSIFKTILSTLFIITFCLVIYGYSEKFEADPKGYIMFCPCMGRFGNQIEQFLGALNFAHDIDRTLVLPHWIEYPGHDSVQIPFDTYFQVEPLKKYTKVILMNDFMKHLAHKVWPKGQRVAFCYQFRDKTKNSCEAKHGNPFGPYWDKFGIDFDHNAKYGPLGYDMDFGHHKTTWIDNFSADRFPVLAFVGAPGAFPVEKKNVHLQKYLKWSNSINSKADQFMKAFKPNSEDKFIGIHLRNGNDFKKACEHTRDMKNNNFFASAQCLGYEVEKGDLTIELCYPSEKTILIQVGEALEKTGAKHAYVASDYDHMIKKFEKRFKNVKFVKYFMENPHVDLCIMARADHSIANCVSTFSAFLKRQRDSEKKSTDFWAFKPKYVEHEL